MSILKKNFRRIFMLTGILIFALSVSCFAAVESEDVATIGEEGYATLAEAISSIEKSGEIKMIKDIELEGTATIPKDKEITLDLNGKVISGVDTQTNKRYTIVYEGVKVNFDLTAEGLAIQKERKALDQF